MAVKQFDIESCIVLLHTISTPFGVAPMSSSKVKSTAGKLRSGVLPLGIVTLLILSFVSAYKMEHETRARKILILFKGYRAIGMILTILYSLQDNHNFRIIIDRVQAVDEKLSSLEQPLNYKSLIIFLAGMYIFLLLFSSLGFYLVLLDTLDKPTMVTLSKLFFECYQGIFGLLVMIHFNFFCIIFTWGFMKIKNMLEAIRDSSIKEYSHTPIKLLLTVSRIYSDIFYGIEAFNKMISVPLLMLVVNNSLDALITITIIYSGEGNRTDYLNLYAILVFYVFVLVPAVVVTRLSEQLCNTLGECNICYTNTEMSLAKNTFLLQQCHQKIHFSISKILPLSVDALVDIFTFGTTIVIFLFQLASTW